MSIEVKGITMKDTGNGIIARVEYADRIRTVYGEDKPEIADNMLKYLNRYGLWITPMTGLMIIWENGTMASLTAVDFYALLYKWKEEMNDGHE